MSPRTPGPRKPGALRSTESNVAHAFAAVPEVDARSSGVVPIGTSRSESEVSLASMIVPARRDASPALPTLPPLPEFTPANEAAPPSLPPPAAPAVVPAPAAPAAPAPAPKGASTGVSNDHLRVGLLSGVAGYVDAAGFVTLVGMFPAHLTGELVGMTVAVSSGNGTRAHLAMVPVFVLSVVLGVLVARVFRRRGHTPLTPLLALMTLALLLFSAMGFVVPELKQASHPVPILLISAVAAMGFQNTFMREAVGTTCPTTVMTGNLTQFIIELVDLCTHRVLGDKAVSPAERKKADARLRLVSIALGGFVGGAALGGWLAGAIGPQSMLLPATAAGFLAWKTWRDARTT